MKVALVIPDSKFLINPRVFPSLGILYISAALKEAGHEVKVFDFTGLVSRTNQTLWDPRVAKDGMILKDADLIGFTATTPQFQAAVNLLHKLPKGIRTVIGGPHASNYPAQCHEVGFDHVVVGEGERAIVGIANGEKQVDWQVDYGYADIHNLPLPDRGAIDIHSYKYYLNGKKTTSMMTSRGCPFNCAFCCRGVWGQTLRYRKTLSVIEEISLIKEMGFEGINFYDDNMLVNFERDWIIFDCLRSLRMVYRCFARSKLLNKKTVQLLARTGCVEVLIGVESGSNRILRNINKGETTKDHMKAIKLLKQWGIRAKAACIIGLPGESHESLRETEDFLLSAQPDDVDFTVLAVYRGSPISQNPDRYDLTFEEETGLPYKTAPGQYVSGVSTSYLTAEEIVQARDRLEAKFKKQELLR